MHGGRHTPIRSTRKQCTYTFVFTAKSSLKLTEMPIGNTAHGSVIWRRGSENNQKNSYINSNRHSGWLLLCLRCLVISVVFGICFCLINSTKRMLRRSVYWIQFQTADFIDSISIKNIEFCLYVCDRNKKIEYYTWIFVRLVL